MEKKFYVPILKWKRGEQIALHNLSVADKARIRPLIEIVPINYDYERECFTKTIEAHLENVNDQILNSWGKDSLFLDLYLIDDITSMADGRHPLTYLLEEASSFNLKLIPVTGINRSVEYNDAIIHALQEELITEVCIRLEDEDFIDIDNRLNDMLSLLNLNPGKCHILIDNKYVSNTDISSKLLAIPTIVNNIPCLNDWLSITLSGSAFPENLSNVSSNSVHNIPRTEWTIWNRLRSLTRSLPRELQFGDYAIASPFLSGVDPRIMQMSGNIRYTSTDNFIIFKGASVKTNGWTQMSSLCRHIVAHPEFCRPTFSWGDNYISGCASGSISTGNAETWRRVGTNHHITFVVNQLSSLSYF